MTTTITVDLVTTGDGVPTTAPHKVSAQTTKDTATVKFTPTHDGDLLPGPTLLPDPALLPGDNQPMLAFRIRMGGTSENNGLLLTHRGRVCGPGDICGANPCSSWSSPSGTQLTEPVTYAETGAPADQDETVNIYVNTRYQGWS